MEISTDELSTINAEAWTRSYLLLKGFGNEAFKWDTYLRGETSANTFDSDTTETHDL
jgi:hypothetical protein